MFLHEKKSARVQGTEEEWENLEKEAAKYNADESGNDSDHEEMEVEGSVSFPSCTVKTAGCVETRIGNFVDRDMCLFRTQKERGRSSRRRRRAFRRM